MISDSHGEKRIQSLVSIDGYSGEAADVWQQNNKEEGICLGKETQSLATRQGMRAKRLTDDESQRNKRISLTTARERETVVVA